MELRHLRYFVAVAREENVSRAALKLHVSQPALSRQIRDLEDELGFTLFERSAKSLRLTPAGRVFFAEASAVLARTNEAVRKARAAATGADSEIHVGYAPSLTARFLPGTLRAFQTALPKARVKLHDLSTEEMLTGVREGKLHIALVVRLAPALLRGLKFEELVRESVYAAVSPRHPFAGERQMTVDQAARQPIVNYSRKDYPDAYAQVLDVFRKAKHKPRIAEEHDSVSSLIAAIESGVGIGIVPESLSCLSGPRLKLIPLSPSPAPLVVGAAWSPKSLLPAAEAFLRCARDVTSAAAR